MTTFNERNFHVLMAVLLVAACIFDHATSGADLAWNPPRVGFVTLAVALVWIGRYSIWRSEKADERLKVFADRIERLEQKTNLLEDALREQRRPLA